jgi:hypothetical protein
MADRSAFATASDFAKAMSDKTVERSFFGLAAKHRVASMPSPASEFAVLPSQGRARIGQCMGSKDG